MITATPPVRPLPRVGDRLKDALARRPGMTWNRLSAASGLDRATIARVSANRVEPSRLTIHALAAALEVDPSWLAGFRDGEPELLQSA